MDTRVTLTAFTFEARYWLSDRVGLQGTMSLEDRDLLNATFPPEGRGGERRHDNLRGLGDVRLLARAVITRQVGGRSLLSAVALGTTVPTGVVRPDPLVGPTDATLQLGSGVFAPLAAADLLADLDRPSRHIFAALSAQIPVYANRHGYRIGPAAFGSVGVGQLLLSDRLAMRAGAWASARGHDHRGPFEITNTGGRMIGALLRVAFAFNEDLSAGLEWRQPLYRFVNGVQVIEQLAAAVSVTYRM